MASPLDNINSTQPPPAPLNNNVQQLVFGRPVHAHETTAKQLPAPDRVRVYPLPAGQEMREQIFVRACQAGNVAEVQHLLSAAPGLTAYEHYRGLVEDAVKKGDSGLVDVLLEFKRRDRAEYRHTFYCAFMIAAQVGHLDVVRRLLQKDKHCHQMADHGTITPLHQAINAGHQEIAKLLVEDGFELEANAGHVLGTPLIHATRYSDEAMVLWLSQRGANPNQRAGNTGITPLALACHSPNLAKVKILLAAGALVDRGEYEGATPLAWAVDKQHEEIVRQLLQHGADLNAACKSYYAPLYRSVFRGRIDLSKILLEAGAAPDLLCEQEVTKTPLMLAVQKLDYVAAELLVDHGADIHKTGAEGFSALELAVRAGCDRIATLLRAKAAEQAFRPEAKAAPR